MFNQGTQDIGLSQAIDYKCEDEECSGDTFTVRYKIKKMSALVSPTGQEVIVPIQVFACEACGGINKEFRDSYLA